MHENVAQDTTKDSPLHEMLKQEFEMVRIELLRRKYFNESNGHAMIQRLGQKKSLEKLGLGTDHYLCVSATACLMKYIEYIQCITFSPHSIKVVHLHIQSSIDLHAFVLFRSHTARSKAT